MNKSFVLYVISRILQLEALLMILPVMVSLLYGEPLRNTFSFLGVIALMFVLTLYPTRSRTKSEHLYAKEGIIITALSWILLSFFGSLPFVISGEIPSLIDAFFETSSGFTTTGSSILTDVEALSHSMLFWRSFTHLVGGMGVLVFALAIVPSTNSSLVHVMKAEVPGPVFGKLTSRLSYTARILYTIYLVMTAVVVVLLLFGGMNLFDALTHAFGAAGTGGFGVKNTSVAYYDSAYIEYVLGIAMIAFGVNFNLYYLLLLRQAKDFFRSEELRNYLSIIGIAILLLCLNLTSSYESLSLLFRDVFFTVASLITTTGYATADFDQWPLFSKQILLLLMFIGGMAGSTAGGLKVSRSMTLMKSGISEAKRVLLPNRVLSIRYEGNILSDPTMREMTNYLVVYVMFFVTAILLTSFDFTDLESSFTAVAATINNIGPGLGIVGPTANFAHVSDFSKLIFSGIMIAGRLEIFPILLLFSRRTWNRHA